MKSRKLSFVRVPFLMFISLLLSISSIQATFLKEEQELLSEVNRSNIRKVLEKHTGENPDLLNSSKGKDIVVFLGKTGAGKSTLINYLSDKELKVDENGNIVLKNPMDSSAMRIGIGGDSETFLPKFIKSNGLLFYDLAGFGDTRGTAISLVNACFIKNIIENAATARLVFVAGQDEITAGRGELFKQLTMITRDLIPNEIIERFSSLVITRSTPGRSKQQLINFLQTKTDPEILAPWIEQGRLVKMSSPFGEEIDLNDKANILDAIFNTPPQKIKNINIGVIYSDKELNNLRKVYYGEIDNATHGLIKNNFDPNTLSSLDRGTLGNKKRYFQSNFLKDVFLSVDTSPLIDLLRPISEKIYHSSWDEMKDNISLTSDKIIGLIDVEIKDQEKKEVEKRRVEEEQRRIQAEVEIQRIQLENAKKEELMREQLRQEEIRHKQIEEENRKLQTQLEHSKRLEQERLNVLKEIQKLDALEQDYRLHMDYLAWHEKTILTSVTYIAPENGITYRHSDMIAGNKKFIEENRAEYNRICKEAERLGVLDIQEKKKREIPTLIKKLDILENMFKTYIEYKAWHEERSSNPTFVAHDGIVRKHSDSISWYNKEIEKNRTEYDRIKKLL